MTQDEYINNIINALIPPNSTIEFWMKGIELFVDAKQVINQDGNLHHFAFVRKNDEQKDNPYSVDG